MALKIMVVSPLHQMGSSVVAAMIAQGATYNNKTSTLLFNQTGSKLPQYLGIEDLNDPTRSVMQIVKLIDNGAISDNDILDYTFNYATNAHLLNTASESIETKDALQIINHVYKRTPTDIVVIDNSEDITTKVSKQLIEDSDTIFVVIQPMPKAFERLKVWLEYSDLKDRPNVFVIVDYYNEVVFSIRDLARYIGLPASRVCKLHYNPWITKCCIKGQLNTVLPLAMDMDPRVVNLNNDIKELNAVINSEIYAASRRDLD